jgi:Flp pilus assembly CpaE family ATPase
MAALFDVLRREYDYVVVDLPHALIEWLEPVIERAGRLVIVTDTSVPCIRQARRLMDFYRESNLGLAVNVVVNRESKPMLRSENQKEAESVLEVRFDHWIPDNPKVARKAADLGHPVVEGHGSSDMGKAFRKLAAALREAAAQQDAPAKPAQTARFKLA